MGRLANSATRWKSCSLSARKGIYRSLMGRAEERARRASVHSRRAEGLGTKGAVSKGEGTQGIQGEVCRSWREYFEGLQ
jgi:hypothetical protein